MLISALAEHKCYAASQNVSWFSVRLRWKDT